MHYRNAMRANLGKVSEPGGAMLIDIHGDHVIGLVRPYVCDGPPDGPSPIMICLEPARSRFVAPILFGSHEDARAFARLARDRGKVRPQMWKAYAGEEAEAAERILGWGTAVRTELELELEQALGRSAHLVPPPLTSVML